MKITAFAASNSQKSINAQLVQYACSLLSDASVSFLDLNDYEMPIYSIDREEQSGIPQLAHDFLARIGEADALIISFAEHNGLYTAAFKNLFDWMSRAERNLYQQKPIIMLATSPGGRGGQNVLEIASSSAGRFGGEVIATVSVPKFYDNFDSERGVLANDELKRDLEKALGQLDNLSLMPGSANDDS